MTRLNDLENWLNNPRNVWIIDAYPVDVGALRAMAEQLDAGNDSPALWSQFGLWYRALVKAAGETTEVADPLDGLLRRDV